MSIDLKYGASGCVCARHSPLGQYNAQQIYNLEREKTCVNDSKRVCVIQ